jgi:hypothetical protein
MKTHKYFPYAILLCITAIAFSSCQQSAVVPDDAVLVNAAGMPTPVSPAPDTSVPEGWAFFPKPRDNSKESLCANYSRNEWRVETENGRIKISPNKRGDKDELAKLPENVREFVEKNMTVGNGTGQIHVEPYENGWLVGSDAGEWGGTLMWYGDDASQKKELIKDNVRGIARVGSEVLVLSGLAHLSEDNGKVWKLGKDEKGEIKASLLKELGSQPQGFVVKDKDLLVALNNKFLRVSLSGETKVFNETSFSYFYPNSMAMDSSGVVYVGARHFIARFVPVADSYKEEWLVPQNCQKFSVNEKEMDCVCQK